MFGWIRHRFCSDLAIDLGTTSTRIGVRGEGIRLDEPSVVAVAKGSTGVAGRGAAVGKMAAQMLGRTPEGITAVRPLQHGVISHFELAEAMLRYFIAKVARQRAGMRPRVVIAVPGGITPVERRAVFNSAERAGAGRIWLIEESRAAGIGAGLPISEPLASMVCDIGGGTTEVAILSLADTVSSASSRVAGDAFDEAIRKLVRHRYSLRIGMQTAEQIKLRIGSAAAAEVDETCEVSGLDTIGTVPRKILLTAEEVREALLQPLNDVVEVIQSTVEKAPPELISDLADTGMVLTGGGALLRGIDVYLNRRLGIPVRLAENPRLTVTEGTLICLDHLERWQHALDDGQQKM